MKFGGTSMGSADRIRVSAGLASAQKLSRDVVVVVSAMSKVTDLLLDNGQRWRIVQGDVFFSKPVTNPKVTIEPGFLGAWWMRMDDATPAVKVQRVD